MPRKAVIAFEIVYEDKGLEEEADNHIEKMLRYNAEHCLEIGIGDLDLNERIRSTSIDIEVVEDDGQAKDGEGELPGEIDYA